VRAKAGLVLVAVIGVFSARAQEISSAVTERSREAPTGLFAGAGVGFTHAQWKTTSKEQANGLNADLRAGYTHGFRSGLVIGAEVLFNFFPSISHTMANQGNIELDRICYSVSGFFGSFFPQIKGTLGATFGFADIKTKIKTIENGKTKEEKFGGFRPEIGLFYMANIWKHVYVRADGRCSIGVKSNYVETSRLMIVLSMICVF
jgi:hypothetical protein